MIKFFINNKLVSTSLSSGRLLLDFLRDDSGLTGTKEGCREGECGACTVLLGELLENGEMSYKACASCLLVLGEIRGKHVVTVEGLNSENLTAVQQALFDNNAIQCGFCTPGIVLSLTGFLLSSPDFCCDDAINALDGNLCRCTGYVPIKKAAKSLSDMFSKKNQTGSRIEQLVKYSVLPKYFLNIPKKLKKLSSNKQQRTNNNIIIAGGTDLLIQKPDELMKYDLEFISLRPELSKIKLENDLIFVGAGVTVEQFRTSDIINKYFPSMKDDLLLVSSNLIRNKATIAGNLVNASPIADMAIILLVLDAKLLLKKGNNSRTVALNNFYKSYKELDLSQDEIIEKIQIPTPPKSYIFNFEKVSNRKYLDIASVNSAFFLKSENKKLETVRISLGGVAPIPLLLTKTCEFLEGKTLSDEVLSKAKEILSEEICPIDDIRGSAEYKKLLAGQLLQSHFTNTLP